MNRRDGKGECRVQGNNHLVQVYVHEVELSCMETHLGCSQGGVSADNTEQCMRMRRKQCWAGEWVYDLVAR